MLGFTDNVPTLLAAADLLVSPALYEPYGLNVQEAITRGVPAIVSARAGVAERYPPELKDMLLDNPTDDVALASRLLAWSSQVEAIRERFQALGGTLRAYTEQMMARTILEAAESTVYYSSEN
jgi:glycosyltransferase involved in cell wall biosynthesis